MSTRIIEKEDAANFIVDFYSKTELENTSKKHFDLDLSEIGAVNNNSGLGDTLSVCHLQEFHIPIWSPSDHFGNLSSLLGQYHSAQDVPSIRVEVLQGAYKLGGGHFFQRVQRAFECNPMDQVPKACLRVDLSEKVKNRVALNFNVGAHVANQRLTIHPRARELYPQHRETIQKFILDHQNDMEFWEFGTEFSGLTGVEDKTGKHILGTIEELRTCEYYLALHSGLMHIAAALDLKSIIIINFPEAANLVLPALKDLTLPDLDWLYPQNVHLHSDAGGPLTPYLDYGSLVDSFENRVYPYFSSLYCELLQK